MTKEWSKALFKRMEDHLKAGGHISECDGFGFSYWDSTKYPLNSNYIFNKLKEIYDLTISIYDELSTKNYVAPFPPEIERQIQEIDECGIEHREVPINTYLVFIMKNLETMKRVIKGEVI